MALREIGRAKLNLTLEILGRRADGYHELRSLVAFAGLGDELALEPGSALDLDINGPFAQSLSGDNLVVRAAEAASVSAPGIKLGRFRLLKQLPVAAGLGGGSADAAAALRLIASANRGALSEAAMAAIAARLGSDVTVCLASRPSLMTGRGELVEPVAAFRLAACCSPIRAFPSRPPPSMPSFAPTICARRCCSRRRSAGLSRRFRAAARLCAAAPERPRSAVARLVPEIRDVLAALLALDGPRLARLSGSGPTCFALFATEAEAASAGARLAAEFPIGGSRRARSAARTAGRCRTRSLPAGQPLRRNRGR
jgi:4-diphosphocytidyl-2-C-methyl-D-erythritol kinase